MLFTVVFLFV